MFLHSGCCAVSNARLYYLCSNTVAHDWINKVCEYLMITSTTKEVYCQNQTLSCKPSVQLPKHSLYTGCIL